MGMIALLEAHRAGLLKLGSVIKFIPAPVIVGFTAGIAVIIWIGQWKDFFGLHPAVSGLHFHEKFIAGVRALPDFHGATTLIAALTLAVLLVGNRWFALVRGLKRVPAPLVAMLVAMGVQATWEFPGVATIGSAFGGIPRALPAFAWPSIGLSDLLQLVGPAFAIALLGAIESLLTAVVADGMTGSRPTIALTVFVDLVVAVNVGVVLASLMLMRRTAESVRIEQQAFDDDSGEDIKLPASVLVYRVEGPFFFGAAEKLERTLERVQLGVETVVIRLGRVPFMDATGVNALVEIIQRFQHRRVRVLLCGIHDELRVTLVAAGVFRLVGEDNVCDNMTRVAERVTGPVV